MAETRLGHAPLRAGIRGVFIYPHVVSFDSFPAISSGCLPLSTELRRPEGEFGSDSQGPFKSFDRQELVRRNEPI